MLDEPFSGLDPAGVDALAGVLRSAPPRAPPVVFSSHQLELVERLCSAVAIVSAGRLVASGRSPSSRPATAGGATASPWRAPRRAGPRPCRASRCCARTAARWSSRWPPDADDQALLDAARAAGRVTSFGAVRPRLADVFREVVEA